MRSFKFSRTLPVCLLLGVEASLGAERPSDSVINASLRGRSGFPIASESSGALSILHSVALSSQTDEDIFVDYGPFTNESSSTMTVSLSSKGMRGRRTLVGGFAGGARHESSDSITFAVPPGKIFGFSVKDYAELTVSLAHGRLEGRPSGMPSAEHFLKPTGKYLGCVEYVSDPDGVAIVSFFHYLYEAGSMSDRSIRRNHINSSDNRVTTGPTPPDPGVCILG